MTHPRGCKNWFEKLELWNGTSLKYEATLSSKLRDISPIRKQKSLKLQNNKCKHAEPVFPGSDILVGQQVPSSHPWGVTLLSRSNSFPFSHVKAPQKWPWKTYESLKVTLWTNSWRENSHNSEMIRHVVFTWWLSILLETFKAPNCLFQNLNFLAAFVLLKTKDNLPLYRGQPHLTCPQSSFTLMDNSTGRPMPVLAFYNNLVLDQLFFF